MSAHESVHTLDLGIITNGHTFFVSYAEGSMTDKNFVSSDLISLDFDSELTVNEVLEILKNIIFQRM